MISLNLSDPSKPSLDNSTLPKCNPLSYVIFSTFSLYLLLFLSFYLASRSLFGSTIALLINIGLISGFQLWVHEASHYQLFRSKILNDLYTTLFFAAPIGVSLDVYRHYHLSHHAFLGTDQDLDRFAYQTNLSSPRHLLKYLLRCLLLLEAVQIIRNKYLVSSTPSFSPSRYSKLASLIYSIAFFLTVSSFSSPLLYIFLWLYPLLSFSVFFNTLRSVSEHAGTTCCSLTESPLVQRRLLNTKTTLCNPFEKFFVYQVNFNYHVEHHLFPHVPAFYLPCLHTKLLTYYESVSPKRLQKSIFSHYQ